MFILNYNGNIEILLLLCFCPQLSTFDVESGGIVAECENKLHQANVRNWCVSLRKWRLLPLLNEGREIKYI